MSDEIWSFVELKQHTVDSGLAIDRDDREIVGGFIGEQTCHSACTLWASLPNFDRQCAVAYTDFGQFYERAIPASCYQALGKNMGKPNHLERLSDACRQRLFRRVRQRLACAQPWEPHVGASRPFIHHDNAQLAGG